MPAVHAKLVTIVTRRSAKQRVIDALDRLGVRGFSAADVEGRGVHGQVAATLFEEENVAFSIVVSAAIAEQLLDWVERDLVPHDPAIAYAGDVLAVPGGHFQ
jgi:nitrogen regulatory protein PII